jgi:hypothetical protein
MSVLPSIIIIVITALLVFRRELITDSAERVSKPTSAPRRRPSRYSKSSPRMNLDLTRVLGGEIPAKPDAAMHLKS